VTDDTTNDAAATPDADGRDDLNFVMKARLDKLEALSAAGVPPFAYGFDRSHHAKDAVALLPEGQEDGPVVRVAGRLVAWRAHGKSTFAHLADPSGRIQLYFKKDQLGDATYRCSARAPAR
jgi:lysyl-tRNA synthetase class 2